MPVIKKINVSMAKNDRYVVKHPEGWAIKKPSAHWVSDIIPTQSKAEQRAKEIVSNLDGGEVRIQGRDGRWRDSDTVAPEMIPTRRKTRSTNEVSVEIGVSQSVSNYYLKMAIKELETRYWRLCHV